MSQQEPVRPETPQQMRELLANTIGDDVFNAMETVGWEHSATPPRTPAVPDNPAAVSTDGQPSTPGAVNPAPNAAGASPANLTDTIDWEQYRDPATGMYLGKYPNKAAAVSGMHSLIHMAKDSLTQAQAEREARLVAEREAEELRRKLSQPHAGAAQDGGQKDVTSLVADVRSPTLDKVLSKLKEGNGALEPEDLDLLMAGISEQSSLVASKVASEVQSQEQSRKNEEAARWADVEAYMREKHPTSLNFVDEMGLYVQTNPEVKSVVDSLMRNGQYKEATVYSWREYERSKPAPDPNALKAEEEALAAGLVRKEVVDDQRRQAGLVSSAASGVHETPANQQGPSYEEVQAAGLAMKQMGDGRLWRAMTIGKNLKGPWFDD